MGTQSGAQLRRNAGCAAWQILIEMAVRLLQSILLHRSAVSRSWKRISSPAGTLATDQGSLPLSNRAGTPEQPYRPLEGA